MPRILLKKSDLRRDTFRAGGKGGQHQNKTESAVRYTHIPTGISAEARSERSQHQNDQVALDLLVAKLVRMLERQQAVERGAAYDAKPNAAFGNKIRTYWRAGQRRVVDHRTGVEGDPERILRGYLDDFLAANLRQVTSV